MGTSLLISGGTFARFGVAGASADGRPDNAVTVAMASQHIFSSMPPTRLAPYHPVAQNAHEFQTSTGAMLLDPSAVTDKPLRLFYVHGGHRVLLDTIRGSGWKWIEQWEQTGNYLALLVGFPPDRHPITGDFGYELRIYDLATHRLLLNSQEDIQAQYDLSNGYCVNWNVLVSPVNSLVSVSVYNLRTGKMAHLFAPDNYAGGPIVLWHDRLFLKEMKRSGVEYVTSVPLPSQWIPFTK